MYIVFIVVLAFTTQSLTSSHRHVLVGSDVTLSYTVARVAEMSCVVSMGTGETVSWNQASHSLNALINIAFYSYD